VNNEELRKSIKNFGDKGVLQLLVSNDPRKARAAMLDLLIEIGSAREQSELMREVSPEVSSLVALWIAVLCDTLAADSGSNFTGDDLMNWAAAVMALAASMFSLGYVEGAGDTSISDEEIAALFTPKDKHA